MPETTQRNHGEGDMEGKAENLGDVSKTSSAVCPEEAANNGAKVYLQRFILLLLEASNINKDDIETVNTVDLKIHLTDEQVKTLQLFAREGNIKSVPLRKLDKILSSVFVKPYFQLPSLSFIDKLFSQLPNIGVGSFIVSIAIPAVWFLYLLLKTRSVYQSFLWLVPVAFILSFVTTAHLLYEEAALAQYEEMKKYPDIPQDCYGKRHNSECSKYLKAHNIDPAKKITPIKVLGKMFGESLSDFMEEFGSGTLGFLGAFDELGFFDRFWILPTACVLLYLFFALLFLFASGGSLHLPLFMGSLSFRNPREHIHAVSGSSSDAPSTSRRLEQQPSTSSITFNFNNHVPHNVNELIQSVSQGESHPVSSTGLRVGAHVPSSSAALNQNDAPAAICDALSEGVPLGSGISRPMNKIGARSSVNNGSRKLHKQYLQLQSKYKSGGKVVGESMSRPRHHSF